MTHQVKIKKEVKEMKKEKKVRVSSIKEEYGIGIPIGDFDIDFMVSASESILNMLARKWDFNFEIVLERSNEIVAIVTLHETSKVTVSAIIEALNNSL